MVAHSPPAEQYREAARLCLLRDAQASVEKGRLKGLTIESRTYNVEGFADKEILTLGGRQKNYLRVAYDRGDLPVLPAHHLLSRLYLEEAHKADHAGVDAMVMRSRAQVWITQVRPKAKAVKNAGRPGNWGSRRWRPCPSTGWGQRLRSSPRRWICSGRYPSSDR